MSKNYTYKAREISKNPYLREIHFLNLALVNKNFKDEKIPNSSQKLMQKYQEIKETGRYNLANIYYLRALESKLPLKTKIKLAQEIQGLQIHSQADLNSLIWDNKIKVLTPLAQRLYGTKKSTETVDKTSKNEDLEKRLEGQKLTQLLKNKMNKN